MRVDFSEFPISKSQHGSVFCRACGYWFGSMQVSNLQSKRYVQTLMEDPSHREKSSHKECNDGVRCFKTAITASQVPSALLYSSDHEENALPTLKRAADTREAIEAWLVENSLLRLDNLLMEQIQYRARRQKLADRRVAKGFHEGDVKQAIKTSCEVTFALERKKSRHKFYVWAHECISVKWVPVKKSRHAGTVGLIVQIGLSRCTLAVGDRYLCEVPLNEVEPVDSVLAYKILKKY